MPRGWTVGSAALRAVLRQAQDERDLPVSASLLSPDLSLGTYRVWQRNRDVVLRLWRSEIVAFLIEPVIALLALGFGLGKFVSLGGNVPYIAFLAPGLLCVFPMF